MIQKNQLIDELITKLLSTYPAQGSNTKRAPAAFMKEALQLKEIAPFLDNGYLYFLSEMSVLLVELNQGDSATFYGVDDWEEGLNILDYPVPDANGFFLVLDICNAEGDIVYFSYNSRNDDTGIIWISDNVDEGPYTRTTMHFTDLLHLICEGNYRSLGDVKS